MFNSIVAQSVIRKTKQQPGFTLIEIAVVLVIMSVILVTIGATSVGLVEVRRRDTTTQNMQKVESALVNFVTSTKRLPCPADGSLTSASANHGKERRSASGVCDAMSTGVVPWASIGITADEATDGWQSLFTYRVPLHLTIDNGMTMTDCDPAGTNVTVAPASPNHVCAVGCVGTSMATCTTPTTFLTNKGLQVRNVAGTILANPAATPPTGAAFVLISAGPSYGPAYNVNGQLVPANTTIGTEETVNQNNLALQNYYVDSDLDVSATTAHFDDVVRRPSVATIISKANLGPRAH